MLRLFIARVNSIVDIVVAKTFRPEEEDRAGFYLRGLFEQFRHELELAGSRFITVDDETLLQILAVLVRDSCPDAGIHNITPRYLNVLRAEHLESVWEDGTKAIRKVFDFFGNYLRLPGPALIPSRYFYMTMASYFFRNTDPDYHLLKQYFWHYSFHYDDLLSNTTHVREHISRLQAARHGEEFGFERFLIDRERLRQTTYSARGRLSRAMLALYAQQDPRDWKQTDRPVLAEVYYELADRPNLHHIFPLDFCETHLDEEQKKYADSLLNIAYLTQITNVKISNKNPLDYLRDYLGPEFVDVQRTHLLPDVIAEWARAEKMPDDALSQFIEERLDLIMERLRIYLKNASFEIIDTRDTGIEVEGHV